jgi:hypothetical protein
MEYGLMKKDVCKPQFKYGRTNKNKYPNKWDQEHIA